MVSKVNLRSKFYMILKLCKVDLLLLKNGNFYLIFLSRKKEEPDHEYLVIFI